MCICKKYHMQKGERIKIPSNKVGVQAASSIFLRIHTAVGSRDREGGGSRASKIQIKLRLRKRARVRWEKLVVVHDEELHRVVEIRIELRLHHSTTSGNIWWRRVEATSELYPRVRSRRPLPLLSAMAQLRPQLSLRRPDLHGGGTAGRVSLASPDPREGTAGLGRWQRWRGRDLQLQLTVRASTSLFVVGREVGKEAEEGGWRR